MIQYVLVTWPYSQEILAMPWANECILMNDPDHLPEIGNGAYFVPTNRYKEYLDREI